MEHITIGVPRGHHPVSWEFFRSLFDAITYLNKEDFTTTLVDVESADIAENRNKIWQMWNKGHLLMVDTDMVFPPNAIHRLWMCNKEIVTGFALMGTEPYKPAIFQGDEFDSFEPKELMEISGCGMFFILFAPQIKSKFSPWPFERREGLSEDLSFCRLAKLKGIKLWCDPETKIGHLRLRPI